MTTTEQLREYLDAHGIDGAPTEPGWYVVRTVATVVVVVTAAAAGRLVYAAGRLVYAIGHEHSGRFLFSSDIVRHAPLTLAPHTGRDLDAEAVAGVQAGRDDLRGLAGKVST